MREYSEAFTQHLRRPCDAGRPLELFFQLYSCFSAGRVQYYIFAKQASGYCYLCFLRKELLRQLLQNLRGRFVGYALCLFLIFYFYYNFFTFAQWCFTGAWKLIQLQCGSVFRRDVCVEQYCYPAVYRSLKGLQRC